MKIHFLNHLFGWWSRHQCFTMFRIYSVVKDAITASSLAGAVITRDRKASRETWPEGVVGKLALGCEPIRLSLQVPWCAKTSQIFSLNPVHLSGRIHNH